MRRGNKNGWLLGEDGSIVGVNLGADYCAEHEWGIEKTKQMFGLVPDEDATVVGIDRRVITKLPEQKDYSDGIIRDTLVFRINKGRPPPRAVLAFSDCGASRYEELVGPKKWVRGMAGSQLYLPNPDEKWNQGRECNIATAWSDGDFGIHVRGKEYCERLNTIWDAFQKKDIAIWVGGGHVFQNGGFILAIRSKCPQEGIVRMLEADKDCFAREKAAKDSGIYELLKTAGKSFHALSPKRWSETKPGEPVFWLNPCEQNMYNFGWFSLDDLKLWAEDKGPVIMASEVKSHD